VLGETNLIEGTIAPQFDDGTRLALPSGHELRAPSGSRCSDGARGMLFIRPEGRKLGEPECLTWD
jgi:hypothetical protein